MGGENADCGPVNPMSGLMKQFGQDRSLQQVQKNILEKVVKRSLIRYMLGSIWS